MFDRRDDNYSIDELGVLDQRLREAAGVEAPTRSAERALLQRRMFAPRRMAVVGLACAAIVALTAIVLIPSGEQGKKRVDAALKPVTLTPLSKRMAISLMARNAENGGLPFARADQFFHTRWERTIRAGGVLAVTPGTGPPTVKYTEVRSEIEDRWVSRDREGAGYTVIKWRKFPTERDRQTAIELHEPDGPGGHWSSWAPDRFMYIGAKNYSREELLNYRPTPEQLIEDLTRHPAVDPEGGPTGIWSSLMEVMTTQSLPLHLRATAIRALGMIPAVEILGARRDRLGRQGYTFAQVHDGVRDELLIEPTTAQVLMLRTVVVTPENAFDDAQIGDVVIDQLLTRFEVVDELPADVKASPAMKGRMPRAAIMQDRQMAAEAHRRDKIAIEKRR